MTRLRTILRSTLNRLLIAFVIASLLLLTVVMWQHHGRVLAAIGAVLVSCVAVEIWMRRGR